MNRWIIVILLAVPALGVACKIGYVPSDTPGVCVEKPIEQTNPAWVSDEKPPEEKMPSYEREGVTLATNSSTADADENADKEKAKADAEGKKAAHIMTLKGSNK